MVCVALYSPAPMHRCRDAELMVLVFPRRASKSALYLDSASSSQTHGSHDCKMWGQESFSARRNTNHVGLHLVKCFAIAMAAGNTFVPFISFP